MIIDALRQVWPEEVLTGRYALGVRVVGGPSASARWMKSLVETFSDDLIKVRLAKPKRYLEIHIGGRVRLAVLQRRDRTPGLPPGFSICAIDPVRPLLTLQEQERPEQLRRGDRFTPDVYRVIDPRDGALVGTIERWGGFLHPARTIVYDAGHRRVGHLAETVLSWLLGWFSLISFRFHVLAGGRRVARLRTARSTGRLLVDVSRLGDRLDPRLVLACATQLVHDSDHQ